MTPGSPERVCRALVKLDPNDPVVPLVELVFEADDPVVTSAVVRKLLAEIAQSKDGTDGRQR